MWRNSQKLKAVVRLQREKIRNGQKKNKRFEGGNGVGALHYKRDQIEQWRYTNCRSPRTGEVTVLASMGSPEEAGMQQGRQLQE